MKITKYLLISFAVVSLLLVGSVAMAYTITIKSGDTLWSLFGRDWKQIAKNNGVTDPTKLSIGQKIKVDDAPILGGLVTKPYTFSPNTVIKSSDINSNFDTLYTLVNGNLSNTNIDSSAAISASKISGTAIISSPSAAQTITGTTTIIGLTTVQGGFIVSTTAGTVRVPSMTNTQRDALTAQSGDMIYSTTDGQFYVREGSAWVGFTAAAETARANTTTVGIVQEATSAEYIAGTATGTTGARLYVNPTSILDYKTSHYITTTIGDAGIVYGDIVYVSSTDGRIYKVLANDSTLINKVYGVAYEGGGVGDTGKVLLDGSIVYTTLAPAGSVVYVSDAGKPTTTAGTYKKIVGRTTSATSWIFNTSPYQETDTPTANAVPIANASSTLNDAWIRTTCFITSTAGVTINGLNTPQAVFFSSDNKYYLSNATYSATTATSTQVDGFAVDNAVANGAVTVQKCGVVKGFSGLTTSSEYLLSTTAGSITTASSTNNINVGVAINSNQLFIKIYNWAVPATVDQTLAKTGSSNSATYVKTTEMLVTKSGEYITTFTVTDDGGGNNNNALIYKNGVAVGTERSFGAGPTTYTQNLWFKTGDLFQIYAKGDTPTTVSAAKLQGVYSTGY